ncbi:MAG: membrane protein insertase YidC [Rubellimicrobium sp.]|nr:membrane protein insertase YidC [Rubellimicrobium sp.]
MDDQNKNLILATALSFAVILVWLFLFPPQTPDPATDPAVTAQSADTGDAAQTAAGDAATAAAAAPDAGIAEATAPRIDIRTPLLAGTLSLQGARLDDLSLTGYQVSIEPGAEDVRLFSPVGEPFAYYAVHGWSGANLPAGALPDDNTVWTLTEGETLTPETPVTLTFDGGAGLVFTRVISVDDDYMFTITDSVANSGAQAVAIQPWGLIARHGRPDTPSMWILHEGVVRMADGILDLIAYGKLPDAGTPAADGSRTDDEEVTANGWTGFTDKYWMATLVPTPGTGFRSSVRVLPERGIFQTFAWMPETTIAAGASVTHETRLFAGAKDWEIIRHYQNDEGVEGFINSIDWGWFSFITKPMFWLLHNLHALIGNMGWAIIALTFVIKALVLPLAYKSYVSMARMKELQPEMEKLKERAGEDKQALQQGMMKLYKDNKVNPAAGCLPVLIQIPIFFSLYKVIVVTIELYHAPWFGYIRDLSGPDPSSLFNLFGLLPWAAPASGSFLHLIFLGIMPLVLGVSMWLQQKLNPAPPDPTQRMIFAWMPWVFMFMMGSFASGLILYWITNNLLSFSQQYLIMRSHGARPDVFGNILSGFRRSGSGAAANSDKKPGGR